MCGKQIHLSKTHRRAAAAFLLAFMVFYGGLEFAVQARSFIAAPAAKAPGACDPSSGMACCPMGHDGGACCCDPGGSPLLGGLSFAPVGCCSGGGPDSAGLARPYPETAGFRFLPALAPELGLRRERSGPYIYIDLSTPSSAEPPLTPPPELPAIY